jgi:hypothetical protein
MLIILSLYLFWVVPVFAVGPLSKVNGEIAQDGAFRSTAPFDIVDVGVIVADVIQVFLSLLSMIFIILILYAGFNWMTAGGDEQKVTKAKDTIYRAVIGLLVTVSAFVITYFVFNALPFNAGSTTTMTPAADGG